MLDYDPIIGRVLSPDNYVQDATNAQSYNRYSYCLNNPLKYTDPDGEWIQIPILAVIYGVMNVVSQRNNINNFWEGLGAFIVGGGEGALTGVNPAIGAIVGGAATNAFNQIIKDNQSTTGFNFNQVDWKNVGSEAIFGAVIGGVSAVAGGAVMNSNVSTKVLDKLGIKNRIARNIIGSGINGSISNTITETTRGMKDERKGKDLWESTWKGFVYGFVGGMVSGGVNEVGYQMQLKNGRNNVLKSKNINNSANASEYGVEKLNQQGTVYNALNGEQIMFDVNGNITGDYMDCVVEINRTNGWGKVTLYWPENAYWQPNNRISYQYFNPYQINIIRKFIY
jgi:hypothetical protein